MKSPLRTAVGIPRKILHALLSFVFVLALFYISTSLTVLILPAYFFLRPLNQKLFSKIGNFLTSNFLALVVHLLVLWCKLNVEVHGKVPSKNDGNSILLPNHLSDCDWMIVCLIAYLKNSLGNLRIVLKDVAKFVPGFGWSIWLMSWPFVSRDWKKDAESMKRIFTAYSNIGLGTILCIFSEGTRFTEKRLLASQKYSASNSDYPILKHCLLPRPKGFITALRQLSQNSSERFFAYNMTLIYEGFPIRNPSVASIIFSEPKEKRSVKIISQREEIENIASLSDEDLKKWLIQQFIQKDALLEEFSTHGLETKIRSEENHLSSNALSIYTLIPHLIVCLSGAGLVTAALRNAFFS